MELLEVVVYGVLLISLAILLAYILLSSMRVYKEYERGVRFRLGRFNAVLGPGIVFIFPYLDSAVKVDMRSQLLEIPSLRVLTAEHATAFIGLSVRYRISSPRLAVMKAADAKATLTALADAIARSQIGELSFHDLVEKRAFINARLREAVNAQSAAYGVEVEGVDVTHVTPSERTLALMGGNTINKLGQNKRVLL